MLLILIVAFLSSTVAQSPSSGFTCFVGYRINNSSVVGGSVPCSGSTCAAVHGTLNGTTFDIFACEPIGICDTIDPNFLPFANISCCNNVSDCNALGITTPPPPTAPSHVIPTLCNEGVYINFPNNSVALTSEVPTICYGDCASFSVTLSNLSVTILTCDPVNICHSLELENSCHTLPNKLLSACCCNSNLCLDPQNGILPTPPPPPPGSIRCPVGVQIIDTDGSTDTKSAVTLVDCQGSCHNTKYTSNGTVYDVYSCDDFGVCDMLDIPFEGCNSIEDTITSCCCRNHYCNIDNVTSLIPPDPFPPNRAERCFSGFSFNGLGGIPIGRSEYCRGNCVTYTLNTNLMIYGCDPVVVCDTFNIQDTCVTNTVNGNSSLQICCCSTSDCNRPVPPAQNHTCVNGISVNFGGSNTVKGEIVPCSGPCGNFSATVGSVSVTVFMCDALNVCQIPDDGVNLETHCCNTTNCNIASFDNFQTFNTSGLRNITCFTGVDVRRQGALGLHLPCQGHCARVHLGSDTFYTCDPTDVCSDFGIDGCNIIVDGISVCCCNGERCNDKDRRIEPHVSRNLSCLVGYSIGDMVIGAYQKCDGMCGQMSASLGSAKATAYLCLNTNLCRDYDLYEECRNLVFDQAIRGCCCGTNGCNYHGNQSIPTATPVGNPITCPSGVWMNGVSEYDSTHVTQCDGYCGSVSFGTTFQGKNASMTYYSCDSGNFCQDLQLTNGCSQLTDTFGFCCCSSSMCMDPLSHKYTPAPNPSPVVPTSLYCFVGYGTDDNTMNGASVMCPGSCMTVSTQFGNSTFNIFACETAGICSWHGSTDSVTFKCCFDTDNCNAKGFITPSQDPNPYIPPPMVCYEGIAVNGQFVAGGYPAICNGDCARISEFSPQNITYDIYTCDPASLCEGLGLDNSCGSSSSGIFSGCCCNDRNLCLDPMNNITTPPPSSGINCFVGYSIDNNALVGGSVSCPGQCMAASGKVGDKTLNVFACEPAGICGWHDPNSGLDVHCCSNTDNCNANGFSIPTPDPNAVAPSPIVCHEGVYINGKLQGGGNPTLCYGDCGSISVSLGGNYSYDIYTCDPVSLCASLNLQNSCGTSPTGMFKGCCCNDRNLCLDPQNGIVTPPPSSGINCFVGYSMDNNTLIGGSVPCPGECMTASGKVGNKTLSVFACEPAGICSWHDPNSGLDVHCCSNADNCNANGLSIPTSDPDVVVPPIICEEAVYLNGKLQGGGDSAVCHGDCASISVNLDNSFNYTIYTCDPVSLCTSLNLQNSCGASPTGMFSGCCCNDRNLCLDPQDGVVTPPPSSGINCFVGYSIDNNALVGGSVSCPGECMTASGKVGNKTLSVFACEPAGICSWHDPNSGLDVHCCSNADNCNVNGLPIPTSDLNATPPPPIICEEGVYLNGKLQGGGNPAVCQGDCASISVNLDNSFNYTIYTCDPVSLCASLSLQNSCGASPTGMFSGCCCSGSNLCLDPTNNVTAPLTTQTTTTEGSGASVAVFSVFLMTFMLFIN